VLVLIAVSDKTPFVDLGIYDFVILIKYTAAVQKVNSSAL
jgi:hypothetical protein